MQNRIAYGLYPVQRSFNDKKEIKRDWLAIIFLSLIFVLPLWPDLAELKPGGIPNIAPTRLIRAALIFYAIYCLFTDRERTEVFFWRIRKNWFPLTLLFSFFLLRFASTLIARIPILEFIVFFKNDFWSYLSIFLIALYVIRDSRDIKNVVIVIVVSAFVAALAALVEFFLKRNLYQGLIHVSSDYTMAFLADKSRDNFYRSQGTFEHPLLLGQFFAMILPWCWYCLLGSTGRTIKFLAFGAGILGILAVYVSGSRAAFAIAAPLLALMFIWELWRWTIRSHNRPAQYLVLLQFPMILGAFVAALVYIKNFAVGTTHVTQGSASIRLEMLKAGISKLADGIFFGQGFGDATSIVTFVGMGGIKTLDNHYLLIALESGIIALILNITLWIYFVAVAFGIAKKNEVRDARLGLIMGLSVLGYCIVMSIHSLQSLTWLLYVIFACILVLREK